MNSRLLEKLAPQVKRNCDISDARYWGSYSICGLLLRLRELYKSESGIRPWDSPDEGDVPEWIGRREALWEDLSEEEFGPFDIGGEKFGPFDVEQINARLMKTGLLYGAGYGIYGKPVFFLSDLEAHETLQGHDVFVSGKEYSRDLSIHPAMLQDGSIFARKEMAALLLWEKFEELKARKMPSPLSAAFLAYGIEAGENGKGLAEKMEEVSASELRTYVHHELGESVESRSISPLWADMLSSVLSTKASMFARAVMDTLADASEHGMLRHIIGERKAGSLGFYMVFLGGYRRVMAGCMTDTFREFAENGDWDSIEHARKSLYGKASAIAENIMSVYTADRDPDKLIAAIQEEITLLLPG